MQEAHCLDCSRWEGGGCFARSEEFHRRPHLVLADEEVPRLLNLLIRGLSVQQMVRLHVHALLDEGEVPIRKGK